LAVTEEQDLLAMFFYALKAPEINRQYPRQFKVFLGFQTTREHLKNIASILFSIKSTGVVSAVTSNTIYSVCIGNGSYNS